MITGLAGKVTNRAAWRKSTESTARDEVKFQRENAAVVQNPFTDEIGHVFPVFDRTEINGTGRRIIIELFP